MCTFSCFELPFPGHCHLHPHEWVIKPSTLLVHTVYPQVRFLPQRKIKLYTTKLHFEHKQQVIR